MITQNFNPPCSMLIGAQVLCKHAPDMCRRKQNTREKTFTVHILCILDYRNILESIKMFSRKTIE